jgi:hypothetical protein
MVESNRIERSAAGGALQGVVDPPSKGSPRPSGSVGDMQVQAHARGEQTLSRRIAPCAFFLSQNEPEFLTVSTLLLGEGRGLFGPLADPRYLFSHLPSCSLEDDGGRGWRGGGEFYEEESWGFRVEVG